MTLRTPLVLLQAAALLLYLGGCTPVQSTAKRATFERFEYRGNDAVFDSALPKEQFRNPILAGFHPDPSITRVGSDFYLINSSFAFYPGLPIFHSTDLVNWRPLGHVLDHPAQLDLDGLGVSRGIFAPTIRYHDGTYYVITTAVDAGGNFLVTAKDPAGPWSDPVWLPELDGIDPDIFFDDDGRVYIAHNGPPQGESLYEGHRAIWLWEYDPETQQIVEDTGRVIVNGGSDLSEEPIWIEAPHIFKKDGWYYLSCAEGGTGYNHSQVIFRTRSLNEPFQPYENNPILTQRDLNIDRPDPILAAGHADMVQTPNGEWWAVFLATRAYDKTHYNTGRETFLLPVSWSNGWPHILPAGQTIPYQLEKPSGLPATPGADTMTGNLVWQDEFETPERSVHWNLLRTGKRDWYDFNEPEGQLSLTPLPDSLADQSRPAVLMYRQKHTTFTASTELNLPLPARSSAGLTAFQNETHHYYFGVESAGNDYVLFLEQANDGAPKRIHTKILSRKHHAESVELGIEGSRGKISFFYKLAGEEKTYLARDKDAHILSTEVAGGFVGTHIGLHARQSFPD